MKRKQDIPLCFDACQAPGDRAKRTPVPLTQKKRNSFATMEESDRGAKRLVVDRRNEIQGTTKTDVKPAQPVIGADGTATMSPCSGKLKQTLGGYPKIRDVVENVSDSTEVGSKNNAKMGENSKSHIKFMNKVGFLDHNKAISGQSGGGVFYKISDIPRGKYLRNISKMNAWS